MTNEEVEALRITAGKIDTLLQRYAQCKKHEAALNRTFEIDNWTEPVMSLDLMNGATLRAYIVPGGPNRQEFIRRIIDPIT